MSVSARDLSEIKKETRRIETLLSEWCLDGEVKYLGKWADAYAEKKAEFVGMPKNHDQYVPLQILTRSKVIQGFYESLQETIKKITPPFQKFEFSLVKYSDIDRLVEEDLDKLTRPSKEILVDNPEQRACKEIKDITNMIECSLSEYISKEEIDLLRNVCLDYAEKRAKKFNLIRGSNVYHYLHAFVRHELMSEVEEFVLGFSDGDLDKCSELAHNFLEHNDLDVVLNGAEKIFGKKSK